VECHGEPHAGSIADPISHNPWMPKTERRLK
jgi:hypothetical protein